MNYSSESKVVSNQEPQKLFDFILQIEKTFPVEQWTIRDLQIWPIIRTKLYRDNLYEVLDTQHINNQQNLIILKNRLSRILATAFRYFKATLLDSKHKESRHTAPVLYFSSGNSMVKENGYYMDKFYQPIHEALSSHGKASICFNYGEYMVFPRKSPSIFLSPKLHLLTIRNFFSPRKNSEQQINLPDFDQFISLVKDNCLNTLSQSQWVKYISKISLLSDYLIRLIKRFEANVIMIICYYSDLGFALSYAAHKIGTYLIDVQHGVQGPYHIAYGRWSKIPPEGYNTMPSHFWVWSENDFLNIASWARSKAMTPFVGGHPYIQYFINHQSPDYNVQWNKFVIKNKPAVLVSLSKDLSSSDHLKPILDCCHKTQDEYLWLFRLHPGMLNQHDEMMQLIHHSGISLFNLTDASQLPLPFLLSKCQVHVTFSSSVVIEASLYQVPSIITSAYGQILYPDFIERGIADIAFTATEIEYKLKEFLTHHKTKHLPNLEQKFHSGIKHVTELLA